MKRILRVRNVSKKFGGRVAAKNVSFDIEENSIVGLIGPNGAGKTVMFNLITGVNKSDSGEIYFNEKRIDNLRTDQIIRKGIRRTFQLLRTFPNMTVLENLMFAMQDKELSKLLKPSGKQGMQDTISEILNFVGLSHLKNEYAKNLSYGQVKLLSFAGALAGHPEPKLFLLDEPFSGVNPVLAKKLMDNVLETKKRGKTFLIIEHNIKVIMGMCEKIIVLNLGEKIAEGKPVEIAKNKKVIDAYLGG